MTKKQIVKTISDKLNESQELTAEIVQLFLDSIVDTLFAEGRIELRNFGVFELRERAPRTARNPHTNESISVPACKAIMFKPGKKMESRLAELASKNSDHTATSKSSPLIDQPPIEKGEDPCDSNSVH